MLTVPTTINLEKACCRIPTQVHPHLPGLTLNKRTTWLAAKKSRTSSRGHHKGLCVIFSTPFAIRADKRHRYFMMEWVCRWCRIVERYLSLHELPLLIILLQIVRKNGDSNDKPTAMQSWSMARSQCWTTVSIRTRSLSALDVKSTGIQQP